MTAIATGIRIGWMNPETLAVIQTTEQPIVMRTTMKNAVSAAHIVFRCQAVGYFVMLFRAGPLRNPSVSVALRLIFDGGPLLMVVLVLSIFSASNLLSGVRAIAFCQKSRAWASRFSFE